MALILIYYYIKMQHKRTSFPISLPLLPGCVSTARSTCGKPNCACKDKPPKLHGPYYRWTGIIEGKHTTKTLTPGQALECRKRIRNFRALQHKLRQLLHRALQNAPWKERSSARPQSRRRKP